VSLTGITAAGTRFLSRLSLRKNSDVAKASSGSGWQAEAWRLYQSTPEVSYAANWIANAMSGATLFAGRRNADGDIDVAPSDSRAAELVASMAGGPDGQSEMLADFGRHLTVAGEGWIVIVPEPRSDDFRDDCWYVLSTQEVRRKSLATIAEIDGEDIEIPDADENGKLDLSQPTAIRVWKPAPWRHIEADSPIRSSMGILGELQLLTAVVAAVARSRITGRGVLVVPQGTSLPAAEGIDNGSTLLDFFVEVASTAIREPDSAAATVPVVVEVPKELIGQVQYLTFASDFDSLAIQLREEAIKRFATGVDVPAEVMLGMGDVSHWGAWALEGMAIRLGVEPKLSIVAGALTTQWLQPILEAEGVEDAREWLVWYDTSKLRTSANKGATSLEAYKEGLISAEAARRELGFTEADAPEAVQQAEEQAPPLPEAPAAETVLPVSETNAVPAVTEPGA
jgi:hypothetical protein